MSFAGDIQYNKGLSPLLAPHLSCWSNFDSQLQNRLIQALKLSKPFNFSTSARLKRFVLTCAWFYPATLALTDGHAGQNRNLCLLATRSGPAAVAQHGRATAAGKVRGRREVEQGAVRRLASFLSAAQG